MICVSGDRLWQNVMLASSGTSGEGSGREEESVFSVVDVR